MKINEFPTTFEDPTNTFKKTFKRYWFNLVAALFHFSCAGFNCYTTCRHIINGNYSTAALCGIFVLIVLAIGCVNMKIFINRYKENKLDNSIF